MSLVVGSRLRPPILEGRDIQLIPAGGCFHSVLMLASWRSECYWFTRPGIKFILNLTTRGADGSVVAAFWPFCAHRQCKMKPPTLRRRLGRALGGGRVVSGPLKPSKFPIMKGRATNRCRIGNYGRGHAHGRRMESYQELRISNTKESKESGGGNDTHDGMSARLMHLTRRPQKIRPSTRSLHRLHDTALPTILSVPSLLSPIEKFDI